MAAINLPNNNLTFVHIPKSAGSSVVEWLSTNFEHERISGHPNLAMIRKSWNVGRSFAVVRNPWSRMVSAYFYLQQYKFYWEYNNITTLDDFPSWNQFIDKLDYDTQSWNSLSTNQYKWIETGVDWLFKAETLAEDFKVIQDLLNCPAPLPYINTSQHNDYRLYYTDTQKKKIAQVFEQDINLYKYTF